MITKLKEVDQDQQKTELTLVEKKSLAEVLIISDQQPADFYKNTAIYQANLDAAIESAKSLVHAIDDDGRKLAKSDVALLRKFARQNRGFATSVFKSLTDKIKGWQVSVNTRCAALEAEADRIMTRFDEMEKQKLEGIKSTIDAYLLDYRNELCLRPEFIKFADISSLIKLSGTLTPTGSLTKQAVLFIKTLANKELFQQQQFDGRVLIIENRCLRAGINPPLSVEGFGNEIHADDDVFNSALERKVSAELTRYEETKALIEKQNAADNQKKIDDALKLQQAEADRIAREKVKDEKVEIPASAQKEPVKAAITPQSLRETAKRIDESAAHADRSSDARREHEQADDLRYRADQLEKMQSIMTPKRKIVRFTAEFEVSVFERISNNAIQDRFNSLLPPDLLAMLKNVVFQNVG